MSDIVKDHSPTSPVSFLRGRAVRSRWLLSGFVLMLFLAFSAADDRVRSWGNIVNIAEQMSYLAVFAAAQAVALLVRGFDLSLGNTVSLVSVSFALVATAVWPGLPSGILLFLGILAALGAALLVGLFNGYIVAYLGVSTFVVTLGSLNICLGLASMLSNGYPVGGIPANFEMVLYSGRLAGVPAPIIWASALLVLLHGVLNYTTVGRSWYLLGDNPRAAVLAGIATKRLVLWAFLTASLLAAVGALMVTARTGSGEPNLGGDLTLRSAAAAAIGGVSLRGGIGGVGEVLLGTLLVTVLSNGMNFTQVNGYLQQIVLGIVIIFAVSLDRKRT